MELARVVGQVVSTIRFSRLPHNSLLLVEPIGRDGRPEGCRDVALDAVGAGEGELVLLVRGSAAARVCPEDAPLDLAIVGIVDQVSSGGKNTYHKN